MKVTTWIFLKGISDVPRVPETPRRRYILKDACHRNQGNKLVSISVRWQGENF